MNQQSKEMVEKPDGTQSATLRGVKTQHSQTDCGNGQATVQPRDFPSRGDEVSLGGVRTQTNLSSMHALEKTDFIIIQYNVHSLMRCDENLERILAELGDQKWDVLVISETWREEHKEIWQTEHGHTWFGSGGSKGQRRVGVLLNKK